MKIFNSSLSVLCAIALMFSIAPVQAKLYKWTDDNGKIHYSDKVPPQHSKHKRDELNEQGITVKKIEATKTAEQLKKEEEQAKIREEQKRKDEKQAAYDQMLLASYLSEEGLINSRDANIAAIENIIQASNDTLKNQEQRLMDLRKSAANHERSGKSVPEGILKQIKNTRDQIQRTHDYIAIKQEEQETTRRKYEKDIQRYRELKGNDSNHDNENAATTEKSTATSN
ncbi:MAG: DUF4124 domain-containing protein [Gammaproteobacteria bacterium]|nr:DUF4124 domain-containing protein [Gammaproteobacteria bacterium]